MSGWMKAANKIWYLWKRNNWMLDPRSWFGKFEEVSIGGHIIVLRHRHCSLTLSFSRFGI